MDTSTGIPRHKTAIRRGVLSRPMKCAMRDGLIFPAISVFDYGCGYGQDIALLKDQGIACAGWDPVFHPAAPRSPADVVNLGFVIRVITGRGTFQKFYDQSELRAFIEEQLECDAVPAALGIFYVFKDEALRQQFLANRYRRRPAVPRKRIAELRFEEHREILEYFMATITDLGRLPHPEEFPQSAELVVRFGSLKRAFALVRRVTGEAEWQTIRERRTHSGGG
jgi:hypothetical protein